MEKISWKNFGAIKALSAGPISGGGICVLVGGQGTGKSTALAGVTQRLAGQSMGIDLQPRDGTTKGELWIGAAKLTVMRSGKRNSGELEVSHLESRFDISLLVDPRIKDPFAADQARIKALIVLYGATANPSDFADVVGGQEAFDELGVDCETTDPIVLAGRTSRALQKTALKCERKSTAEFAAAKAKRDEAGKVDMTQQSDGIVLQSAYDGAHMLVASLDTRQLQYAEQRVSVAKAGESLDDVAYDGPSAEEASKSLADHRYSADAKAKEIDKAQADLTRAKGELAIIRTNVDEAVQVVKSRLSHDEMVKGLREVIASAQLEPVSDDTIAAAEDARHDASDAIGIGVAVRAAKVSANEAEAHELSAIEAQERAEMLRDQSKAVDEILSELIPGGLLRIDEGRIVTETDRSSSELFADKSDGERARLAIQVAVPQLPVDGLLIAPQWMYEGWTESTRAGVDAILKEYGVVMLTAEARDGELAVEVFEPEQGGEGN